MAAVFETALFKWNYVQKEVKKGRKVTAETVEIILAEMHC